MACREEAFFFSASRIIYVPPLLRAHKKFLLRGLACSISLGNLLSFGCVVGTHEGGSYKRPLCVPVLCTHKVSMGRQRRNSGNAALPARWLVNLCSCRRGVVTSCVSGRACVQAVPGRSYLQRQPPFPDGFPGTRAEGRKNAPAYGSGRAACRVRGPVCCC